MPVQFSYMVQQPDGGVSTLQSEAERPPTWGELQDHVASTGAQLLPATPAQQPAREQISAPPPQRLPPATAFLSNPPAEAAAPPDWQASVSRMPPAAPSLLSEQARNVFIPQRSFQSQLPSAGAAYLGGEVGTGLGIVAGAPLGPAGVAVTTPIAAAGTAALFSGSTEAAQIGLEHLLGWHPAEPGTFWQRVGNAAIRGATFEGGAQALRLAPQIALRTASTVVSPILNMFGRVAETAPATELFPRGSANVMSGLRAGSQAVGATPIWPGATTTMGPPPPGYTPASPGG